MVTTASQLPNIDTNDPKTLETWLSSISSQYNNIELEKISKAYTLAPSLLPTNILVTGETQWQHNLATANILTQLHVDVETLQAALLQGSVNNAKLEQALGNHVTTMIANLAKLQLVGDLVLNKPVSYDHIEGLRRLLLGIVEDVRTMLIVLAGRLHLLRVSKNLATEIRHQLATETHTLYAPLANRLGIWQLKWELEDMSLRFLEPQEYNRIAGLLDESRVAREQYINQIINIIQIDFNKAGFKAQITGRPKHIYSIWRKMVRKKLGFENIFDVLAVRILVDTVTDCYAALGIVHSLWRHIPGEFDDYIATPKANNYQSIHTAVTGPENKPVEIQIRTHKMHKHAELGVAAHWRYKENANHNPELERRILWMRRWLEHKGGNNTDETYDPQLEPNQVYVLTPQNKVIELPKGATALDFAYAIHSDLGHACRGAKVKGRLISLTQALESGQTVEILTSKKQTPSRDWLNPHLGYLHTSRARNRVRHWFKQQDFARNLALGRTILERELARVGINKLPNLDALDNVALKFNYKKSDDLLAAIGCDDVSPLQVLGQMQLTPERSNIAATPKPKSVSPKTTNRNNIVTVDGVEDLMINMAKCCKPIPNDPLVGFITLGRGVTVHRANCRSLRHLSESHRARLVPVQWSSNTISDATYLVDIFVSAVDRKGLLRDLSAIIASEDVAVLSVKSTSHRGTDIATLDFTVEINNLQQLEFMFNKIRQVSEVLDVKRQS
ncbi:(p)ppGpp synthetase [Achromatium sp. WMS3]|nr:(p)ppGpp synthetase [Achromatium sp. WMS3]